jgi:uncharacterized membrane protein
MRKKPLFRVAMIAAVIALLLGVSTLTATVAGTVVTVRYVDYVEQTYPEFDGTVLHFAQIVLTESGRDVAEKLRARTRLAVELIGGGLPEEKREVFYEALEFISSNLHKISETGLPET